jgi:hypothetical protein
MNIIRPPRDRAELEALYELRRELQSRKADAEQALIDAVNDEQHAVADARRVEIAALTRQVQDIYSVILDHLAVANRKEQQP